MLNLPKNLEIIYEILKIVNNSALSACVKRLLNRTNPSYSDLLNIKFLIFATALKQVDLTEIRINVFNFF